MPLGNGNEVPTGFVVDGAGDTGQTFTAGQQEDKPPAERRPSAVSKRSAKVVDGLAKQFGMLGMFVFLGNQYDGSIIITQALPMAESLEQIGRKNKTFYRVLVLLAEESEWTALFMAFGGCGVAIAANHGLVPRGWTKAFQLDPPPARGEATEQGPSQGPMMGPSEHTRDEYGNEWRPTQDGGANLQPEIAGLHINADMYQKIVEAANAEAVRQQKLAQQQGIMP